MKKKIIGGTIAILIVSVILQVPNYLRYEIEDMFGNPQTHFNYINLGVTLNEVGGGYEEEINLEEQTKVNIDLAKFSGNKADLFLYGRYVNSADPLIVVLNEVIYNGQPQSEMSNFYSSDYINKHFVIKLTEFLQEGENRLVINTGNYTKKYDINIIK
ncbi:hypothetical protein [Paenibacillus glacialis]|uniref:Uncharacterized protein n=1 Tax=Paenibacillus glacialis TaxID=494026 RepID=A0A168NPD7_9BACL|nr:hypothetical protein [Paenibacillus glacialis]OAB45996.1 hypothetical protein PGLA_00945 [Paenibacillus glacialis]